MIKAGRHRAEARSWPTSSRQLVFDVMLEQQGHQGRERDHPAPRRWPARRRRSDANMPNEFVTNDDFCPGCGLELKNMPAKMQLWTEVFQRELEEADDPVDMPTTSQAGRAGVPRLGTGALLSAEPRACRRPARRYQGDEEGAAAEVRLRARRGRTSRSRVEPAARDPRQPDEARRRSAAPLPQHSVHRRADAVHEGQRPPGAGRGHREAADRDARDRQPHLEGPLRHRHRRHAEQLRHDRRTADQSGAARIPGADFRRERQVDQEAASRDHAERGLSVERRRTPPAPRRTPATACTGGRTAGG